ncbi:hypothetical protein BDB00DRAFT_826630 [Zychaea mexicana]|uniref:uncharacterized protein n=1 Tax=Zychaea mexicana TaxID=64656 RepID=UPI0022FE411C|nr:uncharacterized protein BDB00DRAFT_826630 [Zychaea mexicana]KAI9492840.1 hypothetical protein BDB00DRAFT_826630 [Zychaea mexicana]
MSRIARPFHVNLHEDSVQEPGIARISGPYQSTVTASASPKKRLARLPNSYTRDDSNGPAVADAPKLQRRSATNPIPATKRPSKTSKATLRSSTSSTEELSEPEPILRFGSPKIKPARSSYNGSSPSPSDLAKTTTTATTTHTATTTSKKSPASLSSSSSTKENMVVGSKVAVPSMGVTGTLQFLGPTEFKPGIWAGIELDDSGTGKNDGCVQGIRYFTCPPHKGLFISDSKIAALDVDHSEEKPVATKTTAAISTSYSSTTTGLSPPTQRRSRQPIPEISRSSIVSRRSKTLAASTRKPSKTSINRSSDTAAKKTSRYSVDKLAAVEPVPPVPDINARNDGAQKAERRVSSALGPQSTSPDVTATPAAAATAAAAAGAVAEKVSSSPANGESQNTSTTAAAAPAASSPSPAPAAKTVSEQELYHIYELLEKVQREKDKLTSEISSKEAAWERLVSTKESYALRVKEKDEELARLQQQMSDIQQKFETAQQQLQKQQTLLDKNVKHDSSQEQSLRRIEKLEGIIEDMKAKTAGTIETHETQLRESKGQLDHLHHALKEQETMSAALERECEELRKAGLEAINAYETSILELKKKSQQTEEEKSAQIDELNKVVADLRRGDFSALDDYDSHDRYADEWHDQRIRLEEQLELATDEVEQERIRNHTLANENDKLRKELQLFQMSSASSDDRFDTLRRELETELQDKRRLMEEADAAFEAQARAEDENYQMKMARVKMERELEEAHQQIQLLQEGNSAANGDGISPAHHGEDENTNNIQIAQLSAQVKEEQQGRQVLQKECDRLRESQNELERECMRLMDELMVVEQNGSSSRPAAVEDGTNAVELRKQIKSLEDNLLQERLRYNDLEHTKRTEITQLSTELAELETLIENGVFEDNDLQQALETEQKRVQSLEKELKSLKEEAKSSVPESKSSAHDVSKDLYCELCEVHGHDVLNCTALPSFNGHKKPNEMYCENCDISGVHSTEDCPKQDEIF